MDEISGCDSMPDPISRRAVIGGLALMAGLPSASAQAPIRLRKLNCFEARVTDVARSVRFYRDLFGMPIQARQGERVCLRIGDGPQFMALRPLEAGEMPAITQIGYAVDAFDPDRIVGALETVGFTRVEAPPISDRGIDHALGTWIRRRGSTREVYFSDARGLIVQLSGAGYCGGGGDLGDRCAAIAEVEPGLMSLGELNHFTVFVNDGAEANRFYQQTFGLTVQAHQGPQAPVTGIGDGFQFVMYAGPRRDGATPATIHHGCFNMHDFDVDRVLGLLSDFGLTARGDDPVGPLMHYVSLRMPERGGAPGGTPELYFTDPDGILLQLQDVSYCGGGGYLGNECEAGR